MLSTQELCIELNKGGLDKTHVLGDNTITKHQASDPNSIPGVANSFEKERGALIS